MWDYLFDSNPNKGFPELVTIGDDVFPNFVDVVLPTYAAYLPHKHVTHHDFQTLHLSHVIMI